MVKGHMERARPAGTRTAPAASAGEPEAIEAAWLSVPEACLYIGVKSVSYFYTDIMARVTVKKLGRLTKVKRSSLDRYMDGLPDQTPSGLRNRHRAAR